MRVKSGQECIEVVAEFGLKVICQGTTRGDRFGDRNSLATYRRSGIEDRLVGHHSSEFCQRVVADRRRRGQLRRAQRSYREIRIVTVGHQPIHANLTSAKPPNPR
jgi:hypothetical protein